MFTPEAVAGYTDTAIFTIINLLVTYFVLKRFLFKPILKVLRTRREGIEKQLQDALEKQEDADRQLAEASRRVHLSTREASEIVTAAKSHAEIQSESILSEARHEATSMVSRADGEISRMRVTMLNEVRDEVADLSVAIASKVIGQVLDEHRQRELVEQFLDEKLSSVPKAPETLEPKASDRMQQITSDTTELKAADPMQQIALDMMDTGNGGRSNA